MNLPLQGILGLLLFVTALTTVSAAEQCSKKLDILFVVDASGSITLPDYNKLKGKIGDFVNVGKGDLDVQYAFLQFGTFIEEISQFNWGEDPREVALDWLYHDGQQSYAGKALKEAAPYFNADNGGRSDALQYIIVLTDGDYTDAQDTVNEARTLRNNGFTVVGMGVGSVVHMNGLNDIASDGYSFDGSNMDKMDAVFASFVDKVDDRVDKCGPSCEKIADVVVVIDSSASIVEDKFDEVKSKLMSFVRDGDFGEMAMDWAYVQSSTTANKIWQFTDTYMLDWQATSRIFYKGHQSYAHLGLQTARSMFDDGRPNANKFVLFISDGAYADVSAAIQAADAMKQDGVTVVSLGVGDDIHSSGLESVSSPGQTLDGSNSEKLSQAFNQFSGDISGVCGKPCEKKADVIVIMDSSASVIENDFDQVKASLMNLVRDGDFGGFGMDWALIQASTTAQTIWSFSDTYLEDWMAVSRFYYIGQQSKSHLGLQEAVLMFLQGRPDVNRFIIFISDGDYDDVAETERVAHDLKDSGVTIFSLGVGNDVNRGRLESVSSPGQTFDATTSGALATGKLSEAFNQFSKDVSEACGTAA